jgi:hypothetical protein
VTEISNIEETFAFTKVLFFGRTLAEYEQMFNFVASDWIGRNVLDCPGGPASFTAETNALGINTIACDPLYSEDIETLKQRIELEIPECLERQAKVQHLFDPDKKPSYPQQKMQAFHRFLDDLSSPTASGHYVSGALPNLPFANDSFDVALSGNFLFLYSDYKEGGMLFDSPFTYEFHLASILEFLRVSREIRIYPIKGPHKESVSFLPALISQLQARDHDAHIVPVPYRDVVAAHDMLVVKRGRVTLD